MPDDRDVLSGIRAGFDPTPTRQRENLELGYLFDLLRDRYRDALETRRTTGEVAAEGEDLRARAAPPVTPVASHVPTVRPVASHSTPPRDPTTGRFMAPGRPGTVRGSGHGQGRAQREDVVAAQAAEFQRTYPQ